MTEIECRKCAFYFQRMENMDKGISVPVEGCVRELEPDICHEFQDKWYAGNDDGFRDSLEEEMMSLEEYRDYLHLKDKIRLRHLKSLLNEQKELTDLEKLEKDQKDPDYFKKQREYDNLMKEKF